MPGGPKTRANAHTPSRRRSAGSAARRQRPRVHSRTVSTSWSTLYSVGGKLVRRQRGRLQVRAMRAPYAEAERRRVARGAQPALDHAARDEDDAEGHGGLLGDKAPEQHVVYTPRAAMERIDCAG
jgi:hypothetical protein